MDLALTINGWIDEEVIFAQQVGSKVVFAQVGPNPVAGNGWDAEALARLANRIEKAGLHLAGLHAVPGAVGETPADWTARLAREAGAAGVGLLSLSGGLLPRRGSGSLATALAPLLDAAAQAGVKLAVPLPARPRGLGTLAQTVRDLPEPAGLAPEAGPLLAMLADDGAWEALRGEILPRLVLVSFDSAGTGGGLDDVLSLCGRLRQAGYDGLVRLGRPAPWKGDGRDGRQARAYATGFLRGVLQAFASA